MFGIWLLFCEFYWYFYGFGFLLIHYHTCVGLSFVAGYLGCSFFHSSWAACSLLVFVASLIVLIFVLFVLFLSFLLFACLYFGSFVGLVVLLCFVNPVGLVWWRNWVVWSKMCSVLCYGTELDVNTRIKADTLLSLLSFIFWSHLLFSFVKQVNYMLIDSLIHLVGLVGLAVVSLPLPAGLLV